jgi:hypothetical protein
MTRPIDADALARAMYEESFEKDSDMQRWDSGCWIRYKLFENVLDEQPTIDAIPIEFIEKRIAELKKLNEHEFIANGGYTSPSDYEQWELERLIRDWREQNDQIH